MPKVFVGLGSNINAENNLRFGIEALGAEFGVLMLSDVYQSASLGFSGDDFLNLVAGFETDRGPEDIHAVIETIHANAGRLRGESRFAPRTLDIDLLLYGDEIIDAPPIRVPREDTLEYSFVLGPLADIAPEYHHPVTGKTLAEHWAEYDKTGHPISPADVKL
ncbi:MAG: 2-amino-4-hydroxy-6-hydroxymethyldihydropteridine diphosphokinase [Pseudomonadota bacterium]